MKILPLKVVLDIQSNPKKDNSMNSKYILFSICTALIIVGIYQIFAVGKYSYPEYKLKVGQVAETEIIAPFDFPILKPATELAAEQGKAISAMRKPYHLSEDTMFEALSTLDTIYGVLCAFEPPRDQNFLSSELKRNGFDLSPDALQFAMRNSQRDKIYESLRNKLTDLYRKGIYENLYGDSVLIVQDEEPVVKALGTYLNLNEAKADFASAAPEAKSFASQLADQLVKANLVVSEDKMSEFSQRRISAIPQSEGMVLANEVIVRKNSRVSGEEIRKLESLAEAIRGRDLRRSPLQETLLTLGLLLFVFIVVSLANHYFGVQSKEDKIPVADFFPINLGFIILVLLTTASNQILGYNNLVIPFAMLAVSAAILVSFEYGILYSFCAMLVMSPFMNWETFTPIILVLSTLMCLVILRRQNAWHEYLMIWLYMVLSLCLSVLAIGIYKGDHITAIVRSLGFSVVSASLSIGGIIVIVPYYERKWNRATKQTLLELLDFNHPLLKKLATEAVGTYHHSLIVGNLTERAAEAIGANPLLARVGSYYHDIGKVINTDIFTENNEDSSDIHATLAPEESAKLIRNHVAEGIALAKKYRIPQPVIDIVMQHHGDSTIRYFWEKAEKENPESSRKLFQYPGPLPQSKEAALVMIADIVESTTKAKNIESEEDIAKIIDNAISRLIKEEQLREAPITLKDLSIVKESFIPVLESIYRKRLDYPEPKKDE